MRLLRLLLLASLALSAEPVITFSKYFKGSLPEHVWISVTRSGEGTYREARDDDRPLHFQLSPAETGEIFALAGKLDHFSRPLESRAKVASMGIKTFRFEDGPAKSEVAFNYSEDPLARELTDWFERVTETENTYIALERAVKFDKLGINQAVVQLQICYDRKRLVASSQFLPLLDRIASNEGFMHMSRERAAGLADAFRRDAEVGRKPEKTDNQ